MVRLLIKCIPNNALEKCQEITWGKSTHIQLICYIANEQCQCNMIVSLLFLLAIK